jgi:hypothetical protein
LLETARHPTAARPISVAYGVGIYIDSIVAVTTDWRTRMEHNAER